MTTRPSSALLLYPRLYRVSACRLTIVEDPYADAQVGPEQVLRLPLPPQLLPQLLLLLLSPPLLGQARNGMTDASSTDVSSQTLPIVHTSGRGFMSAFRMS